MFEIIFKYSINKTEFNFLGFINVLRIIINRSLIERSAVTGEVSKTIQICLIKKNYERNYFYLHVYARNRTIQY